MEMICGCRADVGDCDSNDCRSSDRHLRGRHGQGRGEIQRPGRAAAATATATAPAATGDRARCDRVGGEAAANGRSGEVLKVAKAEAKASYEGTPKAREDARLAHAEAAYDVAKEKCDDMSGNQKDVCVKQAKAAHTKAKADAKVARVDRDATRTAENKRANVRQDAREDTRDARYKVAAEKCDAMSGAAKDQCVKDAKMNYGKM